MKVAKDFPKAIVQIQKDFQKFCLDSPQDLPLVLEVLAFHLDSRQNVFHLGKELFVFCPNEEQELPRSKADLG